MLTREFRNNEMTSVANEFERNDSSALLIRRLKSHHRETYLHSARVSLYTLLLADAMDYASEQQMVIYRSSWLHDIGKLNVPRLMLDQDLISSNEGLLLDHCDLGKQIVTQWTDEYWVDVDMIAYHHENLDGTGYYGRNWKQLSLPARLIRVTDSFDKMINPIADVKGHTIETAFEELYRWSDIIYDLSVVEQFYQLIRSASTSLLLPYTK